MPQMHFDENDPLLRGSSMYTELKTDRLLLRPVCTADAESTFAYSSDTDLTRYMIFFPKESVEEVKQFLQEAETQWQKTAPAYYEFAVLLQNEQIGGVSLWLNEDRTEGELGWLLRREHHGRGYAYEAVCALRDFAFKELHLKKLIAQCDARNAPSEKLMRKLGMTLFDDVGLRTYVKRPETARELTYILKNPN